MSIDRILENVFKYNIREYCHNTSKYGENFEEDFCNQQLSMNQELNEM